MGIKMNCKYSYFEGLFASLLTGLFYLFIAFILLLFAFIPKINVILSNAIIKRGEM